MAANEVFEDGDALSLAATHPTTPASGDPVRVGKLCGVAQTAERSDGTTSIVFKGVHNIRVHGAAAVAVGATLYYHDTPTGSPATSVNDAVTAADAIFGTALEALTLGETRIMRVRLAGTAAIT